MSYANQTSPAFLAQAGRANTPGPEGEERAIPRVMTEIASALGDLETAVRALGNRLAPLLPAGDPFNRIDAQTGDAARTSQPVRAHHCEELHARLSHIQTLTMRVQEMVRGLEI